MEYRQDSEGFALSLIPSSTRSRSYRANAEDDSQVSEYGLLVAPLDMSGASSSGRKSLVKDPYYRDNNLAKNNIYIRDFYKEFLEDITVLINHICKDRDSLELLLD
jgi:hypothetical protein